VAQRCNVSSDSDGDDQRNVYVGCVRDLRYAPEGVEGSQVDGTDHRAAPWYYIEARQAAGFDGFLNGNANVLNGVIIHTGSEASGDSSNLLDFTPATGFLNIQDWSDPALIAGQTFTDTAAGITVKTEWATATGAGVTVTVAAAAPASVGVPTVTVSTDKTSYARGQTVSITAKAVAGGGYHPEEVDHLLDHQVKCCARHGERYDRNERHCHLQSSLAQTRPDRHLQGQRRCYGQHHCKQHSELRRAIVHIRLRLPVDPYGQRARKFSVTHPI
jgi:hypothetical protein